MITLFLLFSLLSLNFNDNIQAEEPFDTELIDLLIDILPSLIDFEEELNPHPFRYVGIWESNKTQNIEGSMEFELYFSTPILTQIQFLDLIKYQDALKIEVYHVYSNRSKNLIENGNKTIKLVPQTQDYIQKFIVKLEDVQVTINKNEYLAFVIELEHSKKPVASFAEKRFDTKIIPRFEKFVDLLRKIDDPTIQEIVYYIDIAVDNLSYLNLDIGSEEFGAFVNVLFSSAFYYGSVKYPSSVKFYNDNDEEIKLFFQSEYSDLQYELYEQYYELSQFPYEKIANETKPTTSTLHAWPPIFTEIDELGSLENTSLENEMVTWFVVWTLYTLGESNEEVDTNKVTYYLAENGKLTTDKPEESNLISEDLSEEPSIWTVSGFERNKILTNITAYLNIHYSKIFTLGKVKINASLKRNGKIIATDEEDLDRTNIFELIQRGPDTPTKFTFNNFDTTEEIWFTDNLSLEVSYVKKPILGSLRPVKINYGSELYPSMIVFTLKETDNIEIGDLKDKVVYAGGSAHYIVNISSKNSKIYKDTVKISAEVKEKKGSWDINVFPSELEIDSGTVDKVHIYVNSTALDDSAYDNDEIYIFINATGKTGFATNTSHVSVLREAIEYNFEVIGLPEEIQVKHGSTKTFSIAIRNKNKGFISDDYGIAAESKHNFTVKINKTSEGEIPVYNENSNENEEISANITIEVPWYTYIESDELTINIYSTQSERYPPLSGEIFEKSFKITINVITPNILESVYKLFESAAKKMGINGKYAGWILISIVLITLVIIALIFIYFKKKTFIDIICLDRIKEIEPDESVKYEIKVRNTYKYELNYIIQSKIENDTQGFDISVDKTELILQPGEESIINLLVKPNDNVKKDDWCETKISIKPIYKNKINEISTITTIKNGNIEIRLSGVLHWPKIFKKDDKVETSFKVWNNGNVSTNKISIVLYINGKEKNKIEDVIIPRGGYADIQMPWITDSGKNEVYIIVN